MPTHVHIHTDNQQLPYSYIYKFLRYVNFEDVTNPIKILQILLAFYHTCGCKHDMVKVSHIILLKANTDYLRLMY